MNHFHQLTVEPAVKLDQLNAQETWEFIDTVFHYYELNFIGLANITNMVKEKFIQAYCEDEVDDDNYFMLSEEVYDTIHEDVEKVCDHYHLVTTDYSDSYSNQGDLKLNNAPWKNIW